MGTELPDELKTFIKTYDFGGARFERALVSGWHQSHVGRPSHFVSLSHPKSGGKFLRSLCGLPMGFVQTPYVYGRQCERCLTSFYRRVRLFHQPPTKRKESKCSTDTGK